jgi:hypothetical protein
LTATFFVAAIAFSTTVTGSSAFAAAFEVFLALGFGSATTGTVGFSAPPFA